LEQSHAVATAASDGSLHVWKVDIETKSSRLLRNINHFGEGEVLAVSTFNTPGASILAYATQRGVIHSTDIRSAHEPFSLNLKPELGYLTALEVGTDSNWIAAGTSRGFIGLWDVRFQTMVKLWRHNRDSPIKCLTNAFDNSVNGSSRPLLFTGCNNNEAALFDASTGRCLQCYRVLDSSLSYVDQPALPASCLSMPYLESVSNHSGKPLVSLDNALEKTTRHTASNASMNALVGNINLRSSCSPYLMTGGSDHVIRCWDLHSESKLCYNISGLKHSQPPPSFEQIQVSGTSRLILCRQPTIPPTGLIESSKLPLRKRQGVVKCDGQHTDSILDLQVVKHPALLLSASRDHTIKLWA